MKKMLTALALAAGLLAVPFDWSPGRNPAWATAWAKDGVVTAFAPGAARLVVFGTQGCAPCQQLKPFLDELRAEYAGRAEIRYIDVWEEGGGQADVEAYSLRAVPTLLFLDKTGAVLQRRVGFTEKAELRRMLDEAVGFAP